MSYENKSNDKSGLRVFDLQLTKAQYKAFSQLLPNGYSLEIAPKPKKDSSHRPSKKIFVSEVNTVKVNVNGNSYNQGEPTPNSTYSESVTPSAKRILRDHNKKKPQTYLEEKFPEIIAVPTTSSKSMKPMSDGAKKCMNLIQRLKKHNCAGPFLQPVDVEGLGLYDYYDIVHEPMDLSTVEKKLKAGDYSSVYEFGTDIRKIWNNASAYNAEGSSIYQMTARMSTYFEKIFKEIEDIQISDKVSELEKKVKMLSQQIANFNKPEIISGRRPNAPGARISRSPAGVLEESMSVQEKKVLCENIKRLQPECLRGVWEIVSKGLPNTQHNKEELVFDIDALPVKVTRELERYVKNKLGISNKSNKAKAKEPPVSKQMAVDVGSYDSNPQYYNHNQRPEMNGAKFSSNSQALAPSMANKYHMDALKKDKDDDAESKSSDSSFISDDSESGSDDERKHKPKPAQNYLLKQQDLANFQAGGHGSMLNSFIVK